MSNPQLENGFTRISNELLEELVKTNLLGAEMAVCLYIIRKTYGYHKTVDEISLTQFQLGTNLSRPTVIKTLKKLQVVNMVLLVKESINHHSSNSWKFNKLYKTWKVVKTGLLVKQTGVTSKDGFTSSGKDGFTGGGKDGFTHKRKIKESKERQKKDRMVFLTNLFNDITGKSFTLTDSRKQILQKFLKNHESATDDDIKHAITNFSKDDWADRPKFMDIQYCLGVSKGVDNYEKWLNMNNRVTKPDNFEKEVLKARNEKRNHAEIMGKSI